MASSSGPCLWNPNFASRLLWQASSPLYSELELFIYLFLFVCFLVVMGIKVRALSMQVHYHWAKLQLQAFLFAVTRSIPIKIDRMSHKMLPHLLTAPELKGQEMKGGSWAALPFMCPPVVYSSRLSRRPRAREESGSLSHGTWHAVHDRRAACSFWRCLLCCSLCSHGNWERSRCGHICTDRFVLYFAAKGC